MKAIVLAVAVICVAVVQAGGRPGGPGGHHGPASFVPNLRDITTAPNYEALLVIANNEQTLLDAPLTDVKNKFAKFIADQKVIGEKLVKRMQDGPAACNKADEVNQYITSFQAEQSARDVIAEIKATEEYTKHVAHMTANINAIQETINNCAAPCQVNQQTLNALKKEVREARIGAHISIMKGAKNIVQEILQNGQLRTLTRQFAECIRQNTQNSG